MAADMTKSSELRKLYPPKAVDLNPKPLAPKFYLDRPEKVAQNLLGKIIIRKLEGQTLIARIVETEAYLGQNDPAAHSFAGRTARTEVIFGPPGHAYVYFIYGMHYCLNVTCEPDGQAGCVLIRALEPITGLATMAHFRKLSATTPPRLLTSGPGRLCQALAITRAEHNGIDLTDPESDLRIASDSFRSTEVAVTPRIGISKASALELRFFIAGNKYVSGPVQRYPPPKP